MDIDNSPHGPDLEKYIGSIEDVLRSFIQAGPFDLKFEVHKLPTNPADPEGPEYEVALFGRDADLLLEKHAALLAAIEHVVLKAVRLDEEQFRRIAFDCQGWRQMRLEELKLMAQVAADRVVDSDQAFALSPMNARERRVIHIALRDRPEVRTQSEGAGPERKVVIFPAK